MRISILSFSVSLADLDHAVGIRLAHDEHGGALLVRELVAAELVHSTVLFDLCWLGCSRESGEKKSGKEKKDTRLAKAPRQDCSVAGSGPTEQNLRRKYVESKKKIF